MSVEASRWAMQADVLKSSSKLVLLNLAQLVRYDADDWTAFASIEYLAKVTHLNRKTVIDALARLREMGAIQDTGRRAGGNRSSVIYRLCPRAVPTVDLASSQTLAGAPASRSECQPTLDLELQVDLEPDWQPELVPDSALREEPQLPDEAIDAAPVDPASALPSAGIDHEAGADATSSQTAEFALIPPTATAAPPRRRRDRRAAAGAGATKLPSAWSLPEKWRLWTHRVRPQWTEEKVDAMEATFTAYWRSRVGDAALSADWFESWRLWVFREHAPQKARGKSWQESWSGIVAKGKALSLYRAPNEPEAYFKLRVFEAAGVPPPH